MSLVLHITETLKSYMKRHSRQKFIRYTSESDNWRLFSETHESRACIAIGPVKWQFRPRIHVYWKWRATTKIWVATLSTKRRTHPRLINYILVARVYLAVGFIKEGGAPLSCSSVETALDLSLDSCESAVGVRSSNFASSRCAKLQTQAPYSTPIITC